MQRLKEAESRKSFPFREARRPKKAHVHGQEYVMPTTLFSLSHETPCWKRGNLGRTCSSQHLRLDSKQFDLLLQRFSHPVPIPKQTVDKETWHGRRATAKISNPTAATARAG